MQDSRSSVNHVSRYVGWLIAGLVIFSLSCSSGAFISVCVTIGLAVSIKNSQLSPVFAYVLDGIAMTLAGGTVSGLISAFLGNLLFQSELTAVQRRWDCWTIPMAGASPSGEGCVDLDSYRRGKLDNRVLDLPVHHVLFGNGRTA